MNTKVLTYVLAGAAVLLAAWLVHAPNPAQADGVPEKYRATVQKGLDYLVKQQHADGHWEGDGGQHPVAMTGLVGLALYMDRDKSLLARGIDTRLKVNYASQVRKAADWLLDQCQGKRDGLLFSGHASETTRYMEGHGLATLFLVGVFSDEGEGARRKKFGEVLDRAVKYIVKAQSSQGGWYHTSKVEGHDFGDVLTTVIQIQALQAAANAGITVPHQTIQDAEQYLRTTLGKAVKDAKGRLRGRQATERAGALAACHPSSVFKSHEMMAWRQVCENEIPRGRAPKFGHYELIYHYYTQALLNLAIRGDNTWVSYRMPLFDQLQSAQKSDGSWPAGNGLSVGRAYATALWCTVLQLDNQSHPSVQMIAIETR
jgi:hypothetical protein